MNDQSPIPPGATQLSPDEVKRINAPAVGSPCSCEACKRSRVLARVRDDIDAGTYETEHKLDVAADRLLDTLTRTPAAEEQDAERWDGLS